MNEPTNAVPQTPDPNKAIELYREGFLASDKYRAEVQKRLKSRVFDTFDQLLRHRGSAGLVAGTRLLDLGSADGAFVAICRDHGLEARGLDISDGVNFERDRLPIDDASVDVVTVNSVIEHLATPHNLMVEARRVLRDGGAMIVVTPNFRYAYRDFYNDPTHIRPYTEISLQRLFKNYGFSRPYVVPWIVKKPAWMWDLPRAFAFARYIIPFRGDAPAFIPEFLKGKSGTILAMAISTTNPTRTGA